MAGHVQQLITALSQIACRCERPLDEATTRKIAGSCQVEDEQVIPVRDMETVYQVPLLLESEGLLKLLQRGLNLDVSSLPQPMLDRGEALWKLWKQTVVPTQPLETVNIVLVGKYVALDDAYLSVRKSLEHAAMRCHRKLNLVSVDSEHLEEEMRQNDLGKYSRAWSAIAEAHGMVRYAPSPQED